METSQLINIAILLHVYLVVRFAVSASFKYAGVYSLKYMLLTTFVPFVGYFLSIKALNKAQNEAMTME